MKKSLRILAFVLLMLSLCGGAQAETGYVTIAAAITASASESTSYLLSGFTRDELPDEHDVTLLFYPWKDEVSLWGMNADGQSEVTVWNTPLCTALFGGYCGSWANLEAILEEDYALRFILQTEENGELLVVDCEEKAQIMYEAILSAIQ